MILIYAHLIFAHRKLTTVGAATVILIQLLLKSPNVHYVYNQILLFLFQPFMDAKAVQQDVRYATKEKLFILWTHRLRERIELTKL